MRDQSHFRGVHFRNTRRLSILSCEISGRRRYLHPVHLRPFNSLLRDQYQRKRTVFGSNPSIFQFSLARSGSKSRVKQSRPRTMSFNSLLRDQSSSKSFSSPGLQILSILSCEISSTSSPFSSRALNLSILSCEISYSSLGARKMAAVKLSILSCEISAELCEPDSNCYASFQFSLARSVEKCLSNTV